jgi:hypothetical protein
LNFDYTYIVLGGYPVFEPMILLTNTVFFLISLYFFFKLKRIPGTYSRQMKLFLLALGVSTFFGALAHAVHYQLGVGTFRVLFSLVGLFSMLSMYYCFRAAYTVHLDGAPASPKWIMGVIIYILLALIVSLATGSFRLIEINGGLALLFSLWAHYKLYARTRGKGSFLVITGIIISMLSIVAHLAKISFHEYFNHKDVAHVIMIAALLFIGRGALLNSRNYSTDVD